MSTEEKGTRNGELKSSFTKKKEGKKKTIHRQGKSFPDIRHLCFHPAWRTRKTKTEKTKKEKKKKKKQKKETCSTALSNGTEGKDSSSPIFGREIHEQTKEAE